MAPIETEYYDLVRQLQIQCTIGGVLILNLHLVVGSAD